jgi:glycosyltransferase involved in cell wall biosynthesis
MTDQAETLGTAPARAISILGCRGVPAAHGGFETFADHLSRFLAERGWRVTVYCQENGSQPLHEDAWCGVRRIRIAVPGDDVASTIAFDWQSTLHTLREPSLKLVLGYNTALFSLMYRCTGSTSIMNMDGIEWQRAKWGAVARAWFYLNDWLGCWASNHLIADNPAIADHLASRVAHAKISMIPYGAAIPVANNCGILKDIGVEPDGYAIIIARPEPENSLLEIVRAFTSRPRRHKLVVLGDMRPETSAYHRKIMALAGPAVIFAGAIYDTDMLATLRTQATLYIHGHQAGGTNPSLIEAMAAGLPVLAHDNRFNRWVAGTAATYFTDETACAAAIDCLLDTPDLRHMMSQQARARHQEVFTWEAICAQYEALLESWLPTRGARTRLAGIVR